MTTLTPGFPSSVVIADSRLQPTSSASPNSSLQSSSFPSVWQTSIPLMLSPLARFRRVPLRSVDAHHHVPLAVLGARMRDAHLSSTVHMPRTVRSRYWRGRPSWIARQHPGAGSDAVLRRVLHLALRRV